MRCDLIENEKYIHSWKGVIPSIVWFFDVDLFEADKNQRLNYRYCRRRRTVYLSDPIEWFSLLYEPYGIDNIIEMR